MSHRPSLFQVIAWGWRNERPTLVIVCASTLSTIIFTVIVFWSMLP